MHLYGYPILGRAGLGNMLFPWARCMLWCKDHQASMLAPRWAQLRIGPYLRRERDKRNYQNLFHNKGYIHEPRRSLLRIKGHSVPEQNAGQIDQKKSSKEIVVVHFQGMEGHFESLIGRNVDVLAELQRITKPKYLPNQASKDRFIGIHIRRGDFVSVGHETELRQGRHDYQISLQWYVDALTEIRTITGKNIQAKVFSDGADSELRDILAMQNVERYIGRSAIEDILMLSQSRIMVASGSTFSMWASYLGQVPAMWYPGQRRQFILDASVGNKLEPEWESGNYLPEEFIQIALQATNNS